MILYNYVISYKLLLRNVEENAKLLAEGEALKIEKLLESSARVPQNFSSILSDTDDDIAGIKNYLNLMVDRNPEVFGSCIAFEARAFNPDSIHFAPYVYRDSAGLSFKYLNSREMDYFSQPWYRIPADSGRPVWTEPYFDEGGGDILMCTYSVPFYEREQPDKLRGIVTIDLSLEWLHEFVESIRVYENGYAFLISADGTIITSPLSEINGLKSVFEIAEERNYQELSDAANDMISGGTGFIPYESPLVDGKSWLYYTHLPSSGWSLSVIIPEKEFMNDLHTLNRDLLFIGVIGFIILLIIVVFISRRITRPLSMLASAALEIGKGDFEARLPSNRSKDEIGQLNASIRKMQTELRNYIINLQETTAAKEKIESELQIARNIQQGIIPKIFPPFPHRDDLDLYAILEPARDVGGDLYDFFFLDEVHLCFTIGDVSGKGVPASLFMAITRTLIRARMESGSKPGDVMKTMNEELCQDNENAMFVTLFLGILNVDTGKLEYCNAGHNYPILLKAGGKTHELNMTHGTPLGAMPGVPFGSSEIRITKGDRIVLYTDGVSEAVNEKDEQYSEARLTARLKETKNARAEKIIMDIYRDLQSFVGNAEQFDDITMLVVGWSEQEENNGQN